MRRIHCWRPIPSHKLVWLLISGVPGTSATPNVVDLACHTSFCTLTKQLDVCMQLYLWHTDAKTAHCTLQYSKVMSLLHRVKRYPNCVRSWRQYFLVQLHVHCKSGNTRKMLTKASPCQQSPLPYCLPIGSTVNRIAFAIWTLQIGLQQSVLTKRKCQKALYGFAICFSWFVMFLNPSHKSKVEHT